MGRKTRCLKNVYSLLNVSEKQQFDSDRKELLTVIKVSETVPDKPTEQLVCPPSSVNLPLFSLPCKTHVHCEILNQLCCSMDGKKRCQKGVPKPSPKQKHAPFLNVIPRECPDNPLVEPWGVQNCTEDSECWPRICCPEGSTSYCRTSPPTFKLAPRLFPLKNAVAYLQCTTPPPPIFDLFPKSCRSSLDCFPNLCCQEKDKKVCRPAKRSVLALIATVAKYIQLWRCMMEVKRVLRVDGALSEWVDITKVLDKCVRDACEDAVGVQMDIVNMSELSYADDAELMAENKSDLQNVLKHLNVATEWIFL
ncbi:unnamed protein product [Timema podura]|uniref:WAP domain-containing protein n=1 Tax=Timema podura TaxID=61482 RepID=A0ABN7NND1_TIMPD|nr:unnamed protein product [Timema podura]